MLWMLDPNLDWDIVRCRCIRYATISTLLAVLLAALALAVGM